MSFDLGRTWAVFASHFPSGQCQNAVWNSANNEVIWRHGIGLGGIVTRARNLHGINNTTNGNKTSSGGDAFFRIQLSIFSSMSIAIRQTPKLLSNLKANSQLSNVNCTVIHAHVKPINLKVQPMGRSYCSEKWHIYGFWDPSARCTDSSEYRI